MNRLQQLFFAISPVYIFQIQGTSMLPVFTHGQKVIGIKALFYIYKKNDVVIAFHPHTKRIIVKRITKISHNTFFLQGDNTRASTDSRNFGWVDKKCIIAKVIYPKE